MPKARLSDQAPAKETTAVAPPLHLPDAASTMEGVLLDAIDFCAQRTRLGTHQAALEALRRKERTAHSYFQYRLAQRVAEVLGSLDEEVKSVFLYEYDATSEDLALAQNAEQLPLHLIVWVRRKTSALQSLLAGLDRRLVKDCAELIRPQRLSHLLDVQVIDDADVESRRGVAALLASIYNRPIQLWQR